MKVTLTSTGTFKKTNQYIEDLIGIDPMKRLHEFAKEGVEALSAATPVDSGVTAQSWSYEIEKTKEGFTIQWINSNINEGEQIAILIQYGHATGSGGYVEGNDYINPAMKPIFDKIEKYVLEVNK